jgi:hypothetical protein
MNHLLLSQPFRSKSKFALLCAKKAYGAIEAHDHSLISSVVEWGEWLGSHCGHCRPGERTSVKWEYVGLARVFFTLQFGGDS